MSTKTNWNSFNRFKVSRLIQMHFAFPDAQWALLASLAHEQSFISHASYPTLGLLPSLSLSRLGSF